MGSAGTGSAAVGGGGRPGIAPRRGSHRPSSRSPRPPSSAPPHSSFARLPIFPAAWAAAFAAAWAAAGCGVPGEDRRFERDPAPLRIIATSPAPDEDGVDPAASIDLCFDGVLDPTSVAAFDALIVSGSATFDTRVEVQLYPYRPAGRRDGIASDDPPWCPGSVLSARPPSPLRAGVGFRLRLAPTATGWDGAELDTRDEGWVEDGSGTPWYTLAFRTAPAPPEDPTLPPDPEDELPQPAPISLAELFEPGEPFDPARGLCSCHRDPAQLASRRLDLRSPGRAFDDLLLSGRDTGTGAPLVSPGRPADSYLIQKLVHTEQGEALRRVRGDPMPPSGPLAGPDRARIAAWIAAGAEP